MNEDPLEQAIIAGLKKCVPSDSAPVPLIKEHDLHHISHMVKLEVRKHLKETLGL